MLRPSRTPAGYRVYGSDDQQRARADARADRERLGGRRGRAGGHAASRRAASPRPRPASTAAADEMLAALLGFDATAGQAAFDRCSAVRSLDAALREVVLPALREVGERWARGDDHVAQEHFATEVITGRLRGLGARVGPRPRPARDPRVPGGERHDIGLLCCGLALHRRGWRVTYLGQDTPTDALASAVVASTRARRDRRRPAPPAAARRARAGGPGRARGGRRRRRGREHGARRPRPAPSTCAAIRSTAAAALTDAATRLPSARRAPQPRRPGPGGHGDDAVDRPRGRRRYSSNAPSVARPQ